MKNKYFSGALFTENLKRFWPIAAVGFIIMFMCGQLEMVRRAMDGMEYFYSSTRHMLANDNGGYIVIECMLALAAAVTVFSYLNKINSVSVHHAMPFSRKTLFITNYVSGLFIAMLPVLITWVLFFALKAPTYNGEGSADIYTVANICTFLLKAFTYEIFTYSICVCGCIISGNGVIAFLTAGTLNIILPAILLICQGYMENLYFGYAGADELDALMFSLHPVLRLLNSGSQRAISGFTCVIYIAVALLLAVLACFLYYRRKLERCGDAYVFEWAKQVVGFLFVFIISSGCGLIFFGEFGYASYGLGALIGLLVGQMISRKTFRIFNRKTLKNLIIYAVLMVLIIGAFSVDLFGYEKRIPKAEEVEKAYLFCYDITDGEDKTFVDPENIGYIVNMHQDIVDDHKDFAVYDSTFSGPVGSVNITYLLKNGKSFSRRYMINLAEIIQNPNVQALCRSDEMKLSYLNLLALDGANAEFSFYSDFNDKAAEAGFVSLSDVQKDSLIRAISSDMVQRLPENNNCLRMTINMEYRTAFRDQDEAEAYFKQFAGYEYCNQVTWQNKGDEYVGYFRFSIYSGSSDTLAWLEKNGFEDFLRLDFGAQDIYMTITSAETHRNQEWDEYGYIKLKAENSDGYYITTDRDIIENVLFNCTESTRYYAYHDPKEFVYIDIYTRDERGFISRYGTDCIRANLPASLVAELNRYNVL